MPVKKNYKSIRETSDSLNLSENEVLELLKYGYLNASNFEGELMVSTDSLSKYQRRFGTQKPKNNTKKSSRRDYSLEECIKIFGCEKEVHKLIQTGGLEAVMSKGKIKVDGVSLSKYLKGVKNNA